MTEPVLPLAKVRNDDGHTFYLADDNDFGYNWRRFGFRRPLPLGRNRPPRQTGTHRPVRRSQRVNEHLVEQVEYTGTVGCAATPATGS